ncbi:class I SAM-dependent methyltransferase [Halobaculum litoreum]|uniref:class I SAM-dependent methyltransferase n=1 Tax=Halobaculum litoreum TaxID=3031998 RepID=UPI0024C41DC7|nr:class I SAM-dependent methyltransferase [Halobaculum sp. DT92]
MEGDDVAYLEAARTVDERAHSDAADGAFRAALAEAGRDGGARVLEAGAGTCGVLRRLLAAEALPAGEWVAVDTDERVLAAGRERLCAAARAAGRGVETEGSCVTLGSADGGRLAVRFRVDDARVVADGGGFDGVVARSFADLLAPDDVLALVRTAAPDGWYHLPLTFDGETRFAPPHPADDAVVDAFHGTMRNRGRAATLLADRFAEAGAAPTVDAPSDWVVEGDGSGGYPADEATFLRTVLDTVVAAVGEAGGVADATLAAWREAREEQFRRGELGYVAANRDLFGRVP